MTLATQWRAGKPRPYKFGDEKPYLMTAKTAVIINTIYLILNKNSQAELNEIKYINSLGFRKSRFSYAFLRILNF